ncbi:MAG: carboxynorspermidine decarboxylase [Spirochaetaceae bacterium]|nr:MAG: carboxynorspermidine decarboxylase [Spirochaetaceae bacterium]
MDRDVFVGFDPARVPSPSFVIDAAGVRRNVARLEEVQRASGATVLMALKAFAMPALAEWICPPLAGVCASGLWEAQLGRDHFGGQVHTYAPAYKDDEFDQILNLSDHVMFNSFGQWKRLRTRALAAAAARPAERPLRFGMRVNPEHSEVQVTLYDPCAPYSRLGVTRAGFEEQELDGLTGLHFHTLCEQNVDALERTVEVFLGTFGRYLPSMQWLNLGGGHHISRSDYDRERLVALIRQLRTEYDIEILLEPGEAAVIHSGVLVAEVLDVIENGIPIAILDTSATAHMPDVLEMPYRPDIWGAGEPGVLAHTYRLGGQTCLAGDVIGDYSFPEPLRRGQRLVFDDMAHYTMVKTTMFNGVRHPALMLYDSETTQLRLVREFGYDDFLRRYA